MPKIVGPDPVDVTWRGIRARIVEGSNGEHSLVLSCTTWRDGDSQTTQWDVPAYTLPILLQLLPIVQQLYKNR